MWPFKKNEEDELAQFERELGLNKDRTGIEEQPIESPKQENYDRLPDQTYSERPTLENRPTYSQQQVQPQIQSNDTQVISAKLDTIKAMLELLNQRIDALEKKIEEKPKQKLW
jgi:hypothetical protein